MEDPFTEEEMRHDLEAMEGVKHSMDLNDTAVVQGWMPYDYYEQYKKMDYEILGEIARKLIAHPDWSKMKEAIIEIVKER